MTKRRSRATHGKLDFWEWMQDVCNQIASRNAEGHTITAADPGTEHGRKLLKALGVKLDKRG